MQETAQQYIQRMLSYVGDEEPLDVLAATPHRLREAVEGLAPEKLDVAPEGRWSIRQIVAHLADCEIVAAYRMRTVLATDRVEIIPFDQNQWADAFRYHQVDVADALDTFSSLRANLLRLLHRVDRRRWMHAGLHRERGEESVTHLIRLYAGHDLNHLKQVDDLRKQQAGMAAGRGC